MKETIKRLATLLCFVAMLSVVSIPAFGGENPWDSDGSNGSSSSSGSPTGSPGTGYQQPLYMGTVYVGIDGLLTFVSQSVNYLTRQYVLVGSGRSASDHPDSRTETSQQKDF